MCFDYVSLDNFLVFSFLNNKIVIAALYISYKREEKHPGIARKALQILLLSLMFIHMTAASIFSF